MREGGREEDRVKKWGEDGERVVGRGDMGRWRGITEILIISLQKEKASRDTIITAKDDQLKAKDREIASLVATRDEQLSAKDKEITAKDSEILQKDRGLVSLQQRCGSLQTQLETVQGRNQFLEVSGFSC